MPEIKITFSDGSIVIFHEEQSFQSVVKSNDAMSLSKIYSLWNHVHDGLIPSFLQLIANSQFFFDLENPQIYYASNAVIKIEAI
ncbi:TPA: hypothetical protein ACGL2S_000901 [Streptococcus agalactiae]|uniref:hypothetical protein n=1 Tax=Streptococcus agalactiae TaxID=1311 RepID=UPI000DFBA8CD|nr:hypothetical protein [Streptococcus agalactiae]SUN02893.1 Uncharacterised protein [Streptococcus agalactiae]HEN0123651.1 hypothetical protein [Streptococcus agalactiae]HEN0438744.1 hypothetical protein [Streptococcus agalactiae]HEN8903825.1 hypothetical protein [Streptococcus agalactiae]HEN8944767.1 hypothetical protein [Streptococcus agalactiae]